MHTQFIDVITVEYQNNTNSNTLKIYSLQGTKYLIHKLST